MPTNSYWNSPGNFVAGTLVKAVDANLRFNGIQSGFDLIEAAILAVPSAGGLKTLFVPAGAIRPTQTDGCSALTEVEITAGMPDMSVLDFAKDADDHAQFQIAFPKSWNYGTVTAKIFWTVSSAVATGVAWGIQAQSISNGIAIGTAFTTAPTIIADTASGTANELFVSDVSGAITIDNIPADGDMCFFRVSRDVDDAGDTMSEDARLLGLQLFYTTTAYSDA